MLDESLVEAAHGDGVERFVVGAVVHDGQAALVVTRSLDDDFLPGLDELPSGGVEPGETLAEALDRELEEEVGFTAATVEPDFLATFDYTSQSGRLTRQFTVAVPLDQRAVRLSPEHSAFRWVASHELDEVSSTAETRQVLVDWFSHRTDQRRDHRLPLSVRS